MLLAIDIENYRSLQKFRTELGQLNVIVGANGAGKTNIYQALRLIAEASRGRFLEAMALEGGLPSVKWAGPPLPQRKKKAPFRMRFGAEFDDLCYRLELGFPPRADHPPIKDKWLFSDDPHVKEELVWPRAASERSFLFKRTNTLIAVRDDRGKVVNYPLSVAHWELGLAELREPHQFPELALMQTRLSRWRFYHGFRSDHEAPARRARIGFHSPVLHEDGANLAAALRTIIEIGDEPGLNQAVEDAFEGALIVHKSQDRRFHLSLDLPGLYRPLSAYELSDGQLRFLCLAAALLSPRPPELMVFNEPESSLHESLLPAVARLVVRAARHSQVCLTTHSQTLANELARAGKPTLIQLEKRGGATCVIED